MSSTSAQAHNVMSELPASHPRRRHQLKRRGPVTWHLRKADKGPASLAIKNHFIAMIGEYVGTVLFMIFALGGTNVANIPSTSVTGSETAGQDGSTASTANTSNLLYIALSFGFSLAVNAWIFFRVSGGLFNPAVSLGMVLVGALTPVRGILLAFVQILGGITGAAIIQAITPGTLNVRTTLGGGCSIVQGLFIEMFLTSLLMLAILLLAAEKHKATFIAPIGIGLALFVAELLGVYYTGGALNPARSFGPNVVLRDFEGYHWIYWVGPILGAILAAGFYKMLKWLQYETVLGPETDVVPPPGGVKTDVPAHHDEEKQVEGKNNTGGNFVVAGPGLGDLLTEGNVDAVFDLERNPGPVEIRLQHMEDMLAQILAAQGGASQRISTSTFVDDGAVGSGKRYGNQGAFDNDTYGNGLGNGLLANKGDIGTGHGNAPGTGYGTGYGTGHKIGHADGLRGNVAAPYTDPIDTQDGRHAAVQQIINPEPHTHAHTPFVPAVAGAEGRPHVDAATRKL